MSVELLAHDLVNRRRAEALQDALAAQLPHATAPDPTAPARHVVASALRSLAVRLDPSVAPSEPRLAVANSR